METLKIQLPQTLPSSSSSTTTTPLMNTFSGNFRARLRFSSNFRVCCTSSVELKKTHESVNGESGRKIGQESRGKARVKMSETQLKEGWLSSLSCPFPNKANGSILEDPKSNFDGLEWVIGVDPDVSGALAVLKSDDSGCSAQVFDTPHLQVLVGKRIRKRLDAKSIVQLLRSFDAPPGTTAFIEQSIPFPQDGKQGWWCGGFGYGLWIGILVASGFSVVPVPSSLWKNHFELSGSRMLKDESRKVACTLFPSMTPLLKRKKDHGRAEALLIAAYGKTRQMKSEPCVM